MDVYIIHMPKHVERQRHMETQMKAIGVSAYRFITPVAVDGLDMVGTTMNRAVRSLYETNLSLLETLAAETDASPYILVLEDDIVPTVAPENVLPTLWRSLNALPKDWQMLYLEYCYESCLLTKVIRPGIIKAYRPLCTAAIVYRRSELKNILPLVSMRRKEKPIDHVYRDLISEKKIQAYSVYPALFHQDIVSFQSTLVSFYVRRLFFGYDPCNTVFYLKVLVLCILVLSVGIVIVFQRKRHSIRKVLK